jgi:hypothetical protein
MSYSSLAGRKCTAAAVLLLLVQGAVFRTAAGSCPFQLVKLGAASRVSVLLHLTGAACVSFGRRVLFKGVLSCTV